MFLGLSGFAIFVGGAIVTILAIRRIRLDRKAKRMGESTHD